MSFKIAETASAGASTSNPPDHASYFRQGQGNSQVLQEADFPNIEWSYGEDVTNEAVNSIIVIGGSPTKIKN